ncbi:MAG: MBL fold metallo-hydrolase [Acidobacteriaceae bacterium]|nr:MBL fold metallo-hydrolase [Acidobacteriaceae bacterium]
MKSTDQLEITRRRLFSAGAALGAVRVAALDAEVDARAAQSSTTEKPTKKYQAKAPKTQPFEAEAFKASSGTNLRWLSAAGFFINSRGTILVIDPLLEGFDMPIMIDMPIMPKDVPHVDAVLITHSDTDHYSAGTCRDLKPVCASFHSTKYVGTVMKKDGLPSFGHGIGEAFNVAGVRVKLTPVDHDWQNAFPNPVNATSKKKIAVASGLRRQMARSGRQEIHA